jgi:hypothetical protein
VPPLIGRPEIQAQGAVPLEAETTVHALTHGRRLQDAETVSEITGGPQGGARQDGPNPASACTWHRRHSVDARDAFRHITLPPPRPALLAVVLFRTIFAFREFTIPWTMTSGGPANGTMLLSIYLYRQMFAFFNYGAASAISYVILGLTILLTLAFIRGTFRQA